MRFFTSMLLPLLIAVSLYAQSDSAQPSQLNGHPALMFAGTGLGPHGQSPVRYTYVERAGTDEEPVFIFHLTHLHMHNCPGQFVVSLQKASWHASCEKEQFDVARSEIHFEPGKYVGDIVMQAGGHRFWFWGNADTQGGDGQDFNNSKELAELVKLAVKDPLAADQSFRKIRGDKARPSGPPEFAGFSEQAAAWRALASRPPLPEDARKQRVLAESYLREKDMDGAIEHYIEGLKACPTWPEGWFNLALLYEAGGEFRYAARAMRNYLELSPDSPDAESAKDKIFIWEDKVGKKK